MSDEDPEITSGLKKGVFNVVKIVLIVISIFIVMINNFNTYIVHSWIKTKQSKKVADITFFSLG
jgi:hypothetical protein